MREWQEPHLHSSNLVYPIFVTNREEDNPIKGFEPNMQWGAGKDFKFVTLVSHLSSLQKKGLRSVMLFGVTSEAAKNATGTMADDQRTPVIRCLQALRVQCPDLMLLADVCLCEYTDHGHCAPLKPMPPVGTSAASSASSACEPIIDNESGVKRLSDIAVAYAKAGAHMVCPSDMMDGRIDGIRCALNESGFQHVSIMAYTSKKASCMYAPFRAAVESTFKGDRKRYQQPCGSARIAKRALKRDVQEGADVVLVKPCLFYGDIVKAFAEAADVPVAVYVVSGEYKMLKDYGEATGSLEAVLRESHVGLMRSGASILITYFTPLLLDAIPTWI